MRNTIEYAKGVTRKLFLHKQHNGGTMSDVFDKEKRSEVMRKVQSKGNRTTEMRLIKLFNDHGIKGWRRNYPVKGHPDFVFPKERVAVFVDGCFWHGHDCRNTHPRDNEEYWNKKRERNMQHDREVTMLFESRGWTVLRIWECELTKVNLQQTFEKVQSVLSRQ